MTETPRDSELAPEFEYDRTGPRMPRVDPRHLAAVLSSVPRGTRRAFSAMVRSDAPGAPFLRPSPLAMGSVLFEEMMMAAMGLSDRIIPGPELAQNAALADLAAETLGDAGLLDDPLRLFPESEPPVDVQRARRSWNGLNFGHTWFPSSYEPPPGLPGREQYLADEANRTVHMYVLRHDDRPRPYLIFLHPHQSGEARDVFLFGSAALFAGLGVNVVHPVLPLHGHRRSSSSAWFPSPDALTNFYACTQAVHDIRSVIHLLRQRDATAIGVQGYSLGGYTAALLAGVVDGLDCVIAGAPPTNFLDVTLRHARAAKDPDHRLLELLESGGTAALSAAVSPLTFAPKLPSERLFILAAVGDALVHAEDPLGLRRHWGGCELKWLHGSHMTGLTSAVGQRFVWQALRSCGVVAR